MGDTNVTSEPGKHVIEVEGDDARDRAMNILEALGVDEPAHRMYIEMETALSGEASEASESEANTPTPAETDGGGGAAADTATQQSTTPEPDRPRRGGLDQKGVARNRPKGGTGPHIKEEDREKGDFSTHTSRHYILAMLDEVGEPLTMQEAVKRNKSLIEDGTVSGALSELYRDKLVDRRDGPERQQGGHKYEYYITDYGKEKLEEHEDFSPEKAQIFDTE